VPGRSLPSSLGRRFATDSTRLLWVLARCTTRSRSPRRQRVGARLGVYCVETLHDSSYQTEMAITATLRFTGLPVR
jgi:hypothetical protein